MDIDGCINGSGCRDSTSSSSVKQINLELLFVKPPRTLAFPLKADPGEEAGRDVVTLERQLWQHVRQDQDLDRRVQEETALKPGKLVSFAFLGWPRDQSKDLRS